MHRLDRLAGVADEIQEDPFERRRIAVYLGQAGIEILLDHYVFGRTQQQPGHPQRLMQHLMDIERFTLEPLRIRRCQHLLDEPRDAVDPVQNQPAVEFGAGVVREHPAQQFGCPLNPRERILDLMGEPRWRQPKRPLIRVEGLLGALLMRQIVEGRESPPRNNRPG